MDLGSIGVKDVQVSRKLPATKSMQFIYGEAQVISKSLYHNLLIEDSIIIWYSF